MIQYGKYNHVSDYIILMYSRSIRAVRGTYLSFYVNVVGSDDIDQEKEVH